MEADQVSCLLRSCKRFAYRITLPVLYNTPDGPPPLISVQTDSMAFRDMEGDTRPVWFLYTVLFTVL